MVATGTALLIGAIVSTLGGLIGGAISSHSQSQANKTNIELQSMANEASVIEAQKNRDWQEMMSNTAHQREVADLKAAGLNPWLSVSGAGSPVTGGATASQGSASVSGLGDFGLGAASANVASSLQSIAFIEALNAKNFIVNRHNLATEDYYLKMLQSRSGKYPTK